MSYLKAGAGSIAVEPETITLLGKLAGLSIPEEDIAALVAAYQSQLSAIELLEEMELGDFSPAFTFDPRW